MHSPMVFVSIALALAFSPAHASHDSLAQRVLFRRDLNVTTTKVPKSRKTKSPKPSTTTSTMWSSTMTPTVTTKQKKPKKTRSTTMTTTTSMPEPTSSSNSSTTTMWSTTMTPTVTTRQKKPKKTRSTTMTTTTTTTKPETTSSTTTQQPKTTADSFTTTRTTTTTKTKSKTTNTSTKTKKPKPTSSPKPEKDKRKKKMVPCTAGWGEFKQFNDHRFAFTNSSTFFLVQSAGLMVQCNQKQVNESWTALHGCAIQVNDGISAGLFYVYLNGSEIHHAVTIDSPAVRRIRYSTKPKEDSETFVFCDGSSVQFVKTHPLSLNVTVTLVKNAYSDMTHGFCGMSIQKNTYILPNGTMTANLNDWASRWTLASNNSQWNQFNNTKAFITFDLLASKVAIPQDMMARLVHFPTKQYQVCESTPAMDQVSFSSEVVTNETFAPWLVNTTQPISFPGF